MNSPINSPTPPDFRLLFESSPNLYLVLTLDLTIIAVSDAYLRATMTAREHIVGRALFEVFPDNPSDPAASGVNNLRASLERVLQHKRPDSMPVQKYDIRRPETEGGQFEERYWTLLNSPVFDRSGALVCIIHQVEDVTELIRLQQQGLAREQMNESLKRQSEALQEQAQILNLVPVLIRDLNDRIVFWNSGMQQMYKWRPEEAIGEIAHSLLKTQFPQPLEEIKATLFKEGHWEGELVHARKGGDLSVVASAWVIRKDAYGNPAAIIELHNDITERKHLEEQLRHSQKMEAIGRLAGGIAHDFNNLLTAIIGYSDLLLLQAGANKNLGSLIEEIRKAGKRAATLTSQLLTFSRKQVLQSKTMNLNEVVADLSAMLKRLIGEDIELVSITKQEARPVKADPGQVEQILVNLAVNARDAMPDGGKLTIETADVVLDEEYAQHHAEVTPGRYVVMAVSDTGHGMDAITLSHIFEPFFTTKERGKGTGLGLSTVYGIVRQSQGHIWVYSEPGHGTTFKIYFPRADEETASVNITSPVVSPRGSETILLVEDDRQVRSLARMALEIGGYDVLEAANAAEALTQSAMRKGPIQLMVTDVVMPQVSGRQLAEKMRAIRPEMKVLYMSGYTDNAIVHHGVLEPSVAFIQKPFSPGELARKVREILG